MESLKDLLDQRSKLIADNRGLLKRGDDEKRELTSDENDEYDRRDKDIDTLSSKIEATNKAEKRKDRQAAYDAMLTDGHALPRQVPPSNPQDGNISPAAVQRFQWGKKHTLASDDLDHLPRDVKESLRKRMTDEYRKAFAQFLRGEKRDYEQLGLMVGSDPKGGYTVPIAMAAGMIKFLDDAVTMRQLGTVLPPTTAKSVGILSFDTDYADADWTAEIPASDIAEDDAARFGQREMMPHLLTKLVKVGMKLLASSSIGIESFVGERIAYRFAITENKAFLTGSGSQRPLGVFVASNDGIPTTRDVTATNTTSFTADDLINVKYSLKGQYQNSASWLFHRDSMKMLRKLKDGNGQYLWGVGLAGQPDTLLDRPIFLDENAPNTFTTGLYLAVFGDFKFYYIQDGIDWQIQRLDELFRLRNQVGFIAGKETDGMPVLAEAFARLKLA